MNNTQLREKFGFDTSTRSVRPLASDNEILVSERLNFDFDQDAYKPDPNLVVGESFYKPRMINTMPVNSMSVSAAPVEDISSEREKRMAAHTKLYENRYANMSEEERAKKERAVYGFDSVAEKNYSDYNTSFSIQSPYQNTNTYQNTHQRPNSYANAFNNTYDINSEYATNTNAYNRSRSTVDNDEYQRTYYSDAAPTYKPTSNMHNYVASIAQNYKEKFAAEQESLLPSEKTMQYAPKDKELGKVKFENFASSEKVVSKNAKKGIFALYTTIVVVIAILIAATGVMISTLSKDISNLENQIAQKQAIIAEQSAELSKFNDDDYIYVKAKDSGMIENNEKHRVKLIPIAEDTQDRAKANWFDRLTDYIGKALGG